MFPANHDVHESADLRVEELSLLPHDRERHALADFLFEDDDEATFGEGVRDEAAGNERDAKPIFGGAAERHHVVTNEGAVDLNFAAITQRPLGVWTLAPGEPAQTRVVGKLLRARRTAVFFEIGGGRDGAHHRAGDGTRDEACVPNHAAADGDVDLFGGEVHMARGRLQLDLHVGIHAQERRKESAEERVVVRRRRHTEEPARHIVEARDGLHGSVRGEDEGTRAWIEGNAGWRGDELAGASMDEAHTKALLETGELPGKGRARYIQFTGRLADASRIEDGDEHVEVFSSFHTCDIYGQMSACKRVLCDLWSIATMVFSGDTKMKILAFAASSSLKSINKSLVTHAVARLKTTLPDAETEVLDLNDFEMPLFSVDREAEGDVPDHAARFFRLIGEADGVVVSYAEHNGNYTAAYKNLFDWMSRIETKVFQQKLVVALSASPGGRGGASVLANALQGAPHHGAEVIGSLSVPRFFETFDAESGALKDDELGAQLDEVLKAFAARLSS